MEESSKLMKAGRLTLHTDSSLLWLPWEFARHLASKHFEVPLLVPLVAFGSVFAKQQLSKTLVSC